MQNCYQQHLEKYYHIKRQKKFPFTAYVQVDAWGEKDELFTIFNQNGIIGHESI